MGETGCLLATSGLQNGNVLGSSMCVMGLGDATRLCKGGVWMGVLFSKRQHYGALLPCREDLLLNLLIHTPAAAAVV